MPSLNPMYVLCPELQLYFIDKDTAEAMSGGVVTFYVDDGGGSSSNLKPIYQLSQNANNQYIYTELNNPATLTSIGTFADDNGNDIIPYLYPYDADGNVQLYYITVYNSDGVLQYTRSAFPNISSEISPTSESQSSDNLLANPQFSQVSFSPLANTAISVSGTTSTEISPDWSIVTTGTGLITVSQIDVAELNVPSNPPYGLQIIASGSLTGNVILRQRLYNTPRILVNGYGAGYFIAASNDGNPRTVSMNYVPSNAGAQDYLICQGVTTANGEFTEISGTSELISDGINPDSNPNGYIDIDIYLPTVCDITISSIQLTQVPIPTLSPNFIPKTVARQKDELFHYYKDSIILQPKDSILIGWDFALNPWQFSPTALTPFPYSGTNIGYCADQTILYTEIANSVNVGSSLATLTTANSLAIAAAQNLQGQLVIMQYVDSLTAAPYWGGVMSALVRLQLQSGSLTSVQFKMRLFYRVSAPATLSASEPISSFDTDGNPIFSAGWTAIAAENDPIYTIQTTNSTYAFDNFTMPSISGSLYYLGVAIYTINPLSFSASDVLYIHSCSLVPNRFAIDVNAKTFDETLRDCEFYYEKTYENDVSVGTVTDTGALFSQQFVFNKTVTYPQCFSNQFRTVKCIVPAMNFYSSKTGALGNVAFVYPNDSGAGTRANPTMSTIDVAIGSGGSAIWTNTISKKYFTNAVKDYNGITSGFANYYDAYILYHYTANAQLGQ